MTKFHSTVSRRTFMKGLGLASGASIQHCLYSYNNSIVVC